MFKKITLSFITYISILCNPLNVFANPNIQTFNNINSLEVAHIWNDKVNVRALPNAESKIIDVVNANQQIEVVAKYPGWAKVCLAIDSYGFIKDQYLEYRSYNLEQSVSYVEPTYNNEQTEENYDIQIEENYEQILNYEEPSQYEEEYSSSYYEENLIDYSNVQEYEEEAVITSYENSQEYETNQTYEEYNENYIEEYDYSYEQNNQIQEQNYNDQVEEEYDDYIEDYNYDYDDYIEEYEYEQDEEYEQDDENQEQDEESIYCEPFLNNDGNYLVDYAKQYVGNPYVYGGNSLTDGVDCSGFTQQVFGDNGISLARTAADQSQGGQDVSMDDLQAGDLLFYDNGGYVGHVAIYCGDGTVVHASNEETGITISDANYRIPVSAKRYW